MALDHEPFLVVLDGMERILIAYANRDASHLRDDDLDTKAANMVRRGVRPPGHTAQSFVGQSYLRKTVDPRVGPFLRRLTRLKASRVLISSRLYPADLQTLDDAFTSQPVSVSTTGEQRIVATVGMPLPGCFPLFLVGLADADAVGLWKRFGVSGSERELARCSAPSTTTRC